MATTKKELTAIVSAIYTRNLTKGRALNLLWRFMERKLKDSYKSGQDVRP